MLPPIIAQGMGLQGGVVGAVAASAGYPAASHSG